MGWNHGPRPCRDCSERLKRQEEERDTAERADARRRNLARNLEAMGVNVRKYGDASLATFKDDPDRRAKNAAIELLDQFRAGKRPSLYLFSDRPGERLACGNGKTHLAVAILRELALDPQVGVRDLRFVFVPELLIEIQDTFDNPNMSMREVVQRYADPELLVWDDLGSEKISDFAVRTLYTILYKREGRSDVFTSNLSLDQLEQRDVYAERITSRIAGAARIVSLSGPDRRLIRTAA